MLCCWQETNNGYLFAKLHELLAHDLNFFEYLEYLKLLEGLKLNRISEMLELIGGGSVINGANHLVRKVTLIDRPSVAGAVLQTAS